MLTFFWRKIWKKNMKFNIFSYNKIVEPFFKISKYLLYVITIHEQMCRNRMFLSRLFFSE